MNIRGISSKQKLKVLAAMCSLTIKNFIIDRTLGLEPNEETAKSFEDYQKKIGLTKHEDFDHFWKEINDQEKEVVLHRTGSHSELFKK